MNRPEQKYTLMHKQKRKTHSGSSPPCACIPRSVLRDPAQKPNTRGGSCGRPRCRRENPDTEVSEYPMAVAMPPVPHPHERRRQASHPRRRIQSQAASQVSHRDEVRVTNAAFGGPREPAVWVGHGTWTDPRGTPRLPLTVFSLPVFRSACRGRSRWRKPLGTANSTRLREVGAVSAVCGASGETPITDGCTGTRQGPAARCHHSFWLRVYYKRRMCQPKGVIFEKN